MAGVISASLACCINSGPGLAGLDVRYGDPTLLAVCVRQKVCIWDCDEWAQIASFKLRGLGDKSKRKRLPSSLTKDDVHYDGQIAPHDTLRSCRFSPSGRFVVACCDDHSLLVWSLLSGKLHAQLKGHNDVVYRCDFLRFTTTGPGNEDADHHLYSSSADGTVRGWDWLGGVALGVGPIAHDSTVRDVHCLSVGVSSAPKRGDSAPKNDAFGGDQVVCTRLVTACIDGSALIWDCAHHCALGVISPDPQWVARTRQLRTHDSVAGPQTSASEGAERIAAVFGSAAPSANLDGDIRDSARAHHGPLNAARWSPDGSLLATASSDGTVRVWDVVSFMQELGSVRAERLHATGGGGSILAAGGGAAAGRGRRGRKSRKGRRKVSQRSATEAAADLPLGEVGRDRHYVSVHEVPDLFEVPDGGAGSLPECESYFKEQLRAYQDEGSGGRRSGGSHVRYASDEGGEAPPPPSVSKVDVPLRLGYHAGMRFSLHHDAQCLCAEFAESHARPPTLDLSQVTENATQGCAPPSVAGASTLPARPGEGEDSSRVRIAVAAAEANAGEVEARRRELLFTSSCDCTLKTWCAKTGTLLFQINTPEPVTHLRVIRCPDPVEEIRFGGRGISRRRRRRSSAASSVVASTPDASGTHVLSSGRAKLSSRRRVGERRLDPPPAGCGGALADEVANDELNLSRHLLFATCGRRLLCLELRGAEELQAIVVFAKQSGLGLRLSESNSKGSSSIDWSHGRSRRAKSVLYAEPTSENDGSSKPSSQRKQRASASAMDPKLRRALRQFRRVSISMRRASLSSTTGYPTGGGRRLSELSSASNSMRSYQDSASTHVEGAMRSPPRRRSSAQGQISGPPCENKYLPNGSNTRQWGRKMVGVLALMGLQEIREEAIQSGGITRSALRRSIAHGALAAPFLATLVTRGVGLSPEQLMANMARFAVDATDVCRLLATTPFHYRDVLRALSEVPLDIGNAPATLNDSNSSECATKANADSDANTIDSPTSSLPTTTAVPTLNSVTLDALAPPLPPSREGERMVGVQDALLRNRQRARSDSLEQSDYHGGPQTEAVANGCSTTAVAQPKTSVTRPACPVRALYATVRSGLPIGHILLERRC